MIHFVAKTQEEFDKDWKIDTGHGEPQSYGFHDGIDINKKTGGNSDQGLPVYAIADYEVMYYHAKSHLTSGFGCHVVYLIDTKLGKRWIHCAHLQENPPFLNKPKGKAGDIIGYIGATGRPRGTMFSHLHVSVFKKDPTALTGGIDSIAKTKQQLNEWWEDPQIVLDALKEIDNVSSKPEPMPEKTYTESEMTQVRLERDNNWNSFKSQEAETERFKSEAEQRKKDYEQLLSEIAQKLSLPSASDKADILGGIERLIEVEVQLKKANDQITQLEKKNYIERDELQREIDRLRIETEELKQKNDDLFKKIEELDVRLKQNQSDDAFVTRFSKIVNDLLNTFKKK